MDWLKSFKDLKAYCTELKNLNKSIVPEGAKVKIGKYKVVDTPSDEMALKLCKRLYAAVEDEHKDMAETYARIEEFVEGVQKELFDASPKMVLHSSLDTGFDMTNINKVINEGEELKQAEDNTVTF